MADIDMMDVRATTIEQLKGLIMSAMAYRQHRKDCELDQTDFCTCGLRAAGIAAGEAIEELAIRVRRLSEVELWKREAMLVLEGWDEIYEKVRTDRDLGLRKSDVVARHLSEVERERDKLKERAEAADTYIDLSPCDPDITDKQAEAWIAYEALREAP